MATAEVIRQCATIAPRLMRLKAAAQYLSLSAWKVRALIAKGELPVVSYEQGAPWLLDVRDLDRWIDTHKG